MLKLKYQPKPNKGVLFTYIDCNMDQLILPMDLETMIPESHVSRMVHQQVEAILEIDIQNWQTAEGRPSYHPKMMLKVILYA